METIIDKKELERALSIAGKAVSSSPMVPLLGNIKLTVSKGMSRVTGTNMEIGVSCQFPSKGGEFETCIPAKTFSDLIGAIYSDEITITLDESDQSVCLETESSSTTIKCMNAEDFPPIPRTENPDFQIPVVQFKEMVNRVAFSAKDGDAQSALSGVLFSLAEQEVDEAVKSKEKKSKTKVKGRFIMFATDGFHISYEETKLFEGNIKFGSKAVVRADILELVSRLLPSEGTLEIQISETKVMFHCETVDIVAQLMNAEGFPDYELVSAIVPNELNAKMTVTVNTLELLRAAKQLKVFATDTSKTVMEIQGVIIHYSIETQNRGNSKVDIVGICKGKPITVGINVHFLLKFLEVCKTPQTIIQFIDARSAIKFSMKDYPDYYHVIMPISV